MDFDNPALNIFPVKNLLPVFGVLIRLLGQAYISDQYPQNKTDVAFLHLFVRSFRLAIYKTGIMPAKYDDR
jgi:hypothetical protein